MSVHSLRTRSCRQFDPSQPTPANINTVKKAFSDLESYGAIYTVPGKGSFVSEKAFKNDSVHDTAVSEVSDAISAARAKGLKKQEIIDILNEIYTQEEEL